MAQSQVSGVAARSRAIVVGRHLAAATIAFAVGYAALVIAVLTVGDPGIILWLAVMVASLVTTYRRRPIFLPAVAVPAIVLLFPAYVLWRWDGLLPF